MLASADHHRLVGHRQPVLAALCSDWNGKGGILGFRGVTGSGGAVTDGGHSRLPGAGFPHRQGPGCAVERCLDPSGGDDGMSNKTLLRVRIYGQGESRGFESRRPNGLTVVRSKKKVQLDALREAKNGL